MKACPHLHARAELEAGFAIYPVDRPLFWHNPPRPAWDGFNAWLRRNTAGILTWNPTYQWGNLKTGHEGVDLGCQGGPVRVSQLEGIVWFVDLTDNSSAGVHVAILTKCPECAGWFLFRYLHLKVGSVKVVVGQHVVQGDLIGTQGMTGNSGWWHSHFEIRHSTSPYAHTWTSTYPGDWATPFDPLAWLDATLADIPLPTLEDIMFCKQGDGVGPAAPSPIVRFWQIRLNRLGASLIADGRYGALTQAAVATIAGGNGAQIGPDEAEKLMALVGAGAPAPGTFLTPGDYIIHLG